MRSTRTATSAERDSVSTRCRKREGAKRTGFERTGGCKDRIELLRVVRGLLLQLRRRDEDGMDMASKAPVDCGPTTSQQSLLMCGIKGAVDALQTAVPTTTPISRRSGPVTFTHDQPSSRPASDALLAAIADLSA